MKKVAGTSLVKSKSSNNKIIKSRQPRGGNMSMMSNVNVESKESKKRGVYVEKWESPKKFQAEEIKRQPEESSQSRPSPETGTFTSLASTSKMLMSTRSPQTLGAPNHGQTKLRNALNKVPSPTTKFPKQTSNTTPNNMPVKQLKINSTPHKNTKNDKKNQRNIIEENKQAVKLKYRSNALRQTKAKDSEKIITLKSKKTIIQTPSDTSKITRNLSVSDHVHWSNIFPSDPQNNTNKNRLQEYIDNRLSVSKCALKNNNMGVNETALNEATEVNNEKDKQIYKFFKDLLESVCDENIYNNKITMVRSGVSSNVQLEIDENVAQKLYGQKPNSQNYKDDEKQSNQHTFKVKDVSFDQSQQLADYYNLRSTLLTSKRTPLIPQKTTKNQRKTRNPKTEETTWKKSKKLDLLKLLKEQLSKNCNTYEEPENMYQALRALARRKCKRQICFDTPEKDKSDSERICRFQRRNVISRSTGLPRKKNGPKSDIPTERYFFESDASTTDKESDHTLEVFGFDYDDLQDVAVESLDNGNYIKYTYQKLHESKSRKKPLTHWKK